MAPVHHQHRRCDRSFRSPPLTRAGSDPATHDARLARSIVEFAKVIGPLTDPRAHGGDPADAVHLVLPSIPGFGLSGPTTRTGWEFKRVAAAFAVLMQRLGYARYGVQGGDWGAIISRELGRTRPEVIGVHLNLLPNAHQAHEPDPSELAVLSPSSASARWPPGNARRPGAASVRGTRTSRRPGRRRWRTA
jgi:epoxide hydrolase